MRKLELIGRQYGRLTVIAEGPRSDRRRHLCRCECGNETMVMTSNLTKGHTQSCGCLQRERTGRARLTHGKTHTPIYSVWCNMLNRCRNANVPHFDNYGGRGIVVCERWRVFENFYADMGDVPEGFTLERIDVNGPYAPANCRWATPVEQQNNTRKNLWLEFRGARKTLAQWARLLGFKRRLLSLRLYKGWTVERAFTTPVRRFTWRNRNV